MTRKSDLEQHIRESYKLVHEYEEIQRLSDDPKEQARSRRAIEEQQGLVKRYLAEYIPLCERVRLAIPEDVVEIAITAGVPLPPAPPVPTSPAHLFISYKQNADPDQRLAVHLHELLTDQGHDVFIEVGWLASSGRKTHNPVTDRGIGAMKGTPGPSVCLVPQ